jgi:osmoprotectant transport system substrate-binding protein
VLAYVYADALKDAGYTNVSVKANLGSREVTAPALANGQIDMIPEYLGNYLTYLNPNAGVLSVDQTYSTLQPLASSKGQTLGTYSQAADSDAVAVTQANATKYGLTSIADLSKVASQWTFGGPQECQTRITCFAGLSQYYGLQFKSFKALDEDGPITVSALQSGQVEAARIFSSDATISQDHFVVLSDPKDFQGAGNIVPVLRTSVATPGVLAVVNKVSAALSTDDLVSFNSQTGAPQHLDAQQVASAYVSAKKL